MKRLLYIIGILLLMPASISAQIYDLTERSNPWNQGRNINGLRTDSTTVSYAELYGGGQAGDFRKNHEAASSWHAGLLAESMLHLEKMSMKGLFTFEHQEGYQMCGSMFVRQHHYPINVIEFTPGRKTRQKYAFEGGLTYDLSSNWRIGGNIAFTSMNYSKRKDLRHTTYLLDIGISPSILWHGGDFSAGLSYVLSKNAETVKAVQIGDTAEEFMVFLDKGLSYGTYENWEGNGVHLKEPGVDGLPVKEIYNGAAIQFSWKDLYLDAEYLYGSGKAGEKDFIWYEFPSHNVKAFLNYRLYRPHARHHFRLGFSFSHLENKGNVLEKTNEGGVTTAHKYASNLILRQEKFNWVPEYELIARKWRIRWKAEFGQNKSITSQIFPYLCAVSEFHGHTSLEGAVHLQRFELGADIGFGMSSIREDERTVAEADGAKAPVRIDSYHNQWLDYERAPKLDCGLRLRFNFWKGLYAEAYGDYLHALTLEKNTGIHPNNLNGNGRWGAGLRFGYNF